MQLDIQIIITFKCAGRETTHNNECGSLPKMLDAPETMAVRK